MHNGAVAKRHHRIAVYSCYTGRHEPLNTASLGAGLGYDRVLISDDPSLEYPGAQLIEMKIGELTAYAASRLPKICPHLFFPEHEWVFYVDNRASLTKDPNEIVKEIEATHPGAPAGRYLFRHLVRNCAFQETRAVQEKGMIEQSVANRIIKSFRHAGMPRKHGLYMNTIMIQKMGNPVADAFNLAWWQMYLDLCPRDQVTLPYMLWKTRYDPPILDFKVASIAEWPVYTVRDRRKFRRSG
jgi:hypothetical protein